MISPEYSPTHCAATAAKRRKTFIYGQRSGFDMRSPPQPRKANDKSKTPLETDIWQCGGSEVLFGSAASLPRELLNQNHTRFMGFWCPLETEIRKRGAASTCELRIRDTGVPLFLTFAEASPRHANVRNGTTACHVFQHRPYSPAPRLQVGARCANQSKPVIQAPAASSGDEHGGYGRTKTGITGHHPA
jgi:hypothetical protein